MNYGNLPKKPTSESWVKDAEALIEMGCTSIDSKTVKGLLHEIKVLNSYIDELEEKGSAEKYDKLKQDWHDEWALRVNAETALKKLTENK